MATPTANNDAGPADPLDPPSATVPLSTMRRVIGARLQESKQNAPHFYLSVDIDIDPMLQLRERLKRENSIEVPSVNDCVVAATARALREVPSLNARIDGNRLRMFECANIGVAVALPGGLVVPVLREADRKDLLTLGQEMRTLAARAPISSFRTITAEPLSLYRTLACSEFVNSLPSLTLPRPEYSRWGRLRHDQ